MKNVVFSHLGISLDMKPGFKSSRWDFWRPNVSLCQQKDFTVDRLHLLVQPQFEEDAFHVVADIRDVSPKTEIVIENFECEDVWNFEQVYSYLYDISQKQQFKPEKEQYYIHLTTGTHVAQICLFLLTESHHFPAKLLQTMPGKLNQNNTAIGEINIIDLDLSKYDKIAARFAEKTSDDVSFLKAGIATKNAAFNTLIERIEKVAVVSVDPILITGPTGAGKSQLARKIFELRKKRNGIKGNFVEVNCATLRADSAMSALFGHVKGAFTGAENKRPGLLMEADGGILFLDEIGELGLDEQAMLLHAIEEKTFLPVGSDKPVSSSFQLLCGTNRNLQERISEGAFREDLFARINLWTFTLLALNQRPEDIRPNVEYEINRFCEKTGQHISFNAAALKRFIEFGQSPEGLWRGNFRDLNAAMTRMGTLAEGGRISLQVVEEEIGRLKSLWTSQGKTEDSAEQNLERLTKRAPELAQLDRFARVQLADVIQVCLQSATISEAGRILFSSSRKEKTTSNDADRLRKYLLKFGLSWEEIKSLTR